MKIKLVMAVIVVVLFSQCKSQNKKTITYKNLKINCSEMYCGGAAPPEELIAEMSKLRPFANKNIQVFTEHNAESKSFIYKTDSLGNVKLPDNLGKEIYINVYSPIEKFYADDIEYKCYKSFINACLIKIDNYGLENEFNISTEIRCNPCLPAAP